MGNYTLQGRKGSFFNTGLNEQNDPYFGGVPFKSFAGYSNDFGVNNTTLSEVQKQLQAQADKKYREEVLPTQQWEATHTIDEIIHKYADPNYVLNDAEAESARKIIGQYLDSSKGASSDTINSDAFLVGENSLGVLGGETNSANALQSKNYAANATPQAGQVDAFLRGFGETSQQNAFPVGLSQTSWPEAKDTSNLLEHYLQAVDEGRGQDPLLTKKESGAQTQDAGNKQGLDLLGDVAGFGGGVLDNLYHQSKRVGFITPRKNPLPSSRRVVPGSMEIKTNPAWGIDFLSPTDEAFKFRIDDGKIRVTGKKYLLENGDLNKVQKTSIEALDGVELPKSVTKLLKNTDDFARVSKLAKNGGTALGIIGYALDAYEFGNTLVEDWNDEDKKPGKKTLKSGVGIIGGIAGGEIGGKLGAMGGAAIGTLICPGLGTVIGGFIGGLVGGWGGSEVGTAAGEYMVDELYQGE